MMGIAVWPLKKSCRRDITRFVRSATLPLPVGQTKQQTARGMRVHLYAQCWNDEFMLPFFFRHYDSFVDRYVIFDDGSSDGSVQILAGHPKVELRRFVRSDPDSFVLSEQTLSNQCWKESRGEADWVIVTDLDEHLFHPTIREYLEACTAAGVTLVPALGFQMIGERPPRRGEVLREAFPAGAPWSGMMKPSIFNPSAIVEINFLPGRHRAAPTGALRVPERDEVFLLHYKYLDEAQTYERNRALLPRLGKHDIKNEWGHQYSWSREQLAQYRREIAVQAIDVRGFTAEDYPLRRWWLPRFATAAVNMTNRARTDGKRPLPANRSRTALSKASTAGCATSC
jgi:Glycosyl transferase family 2